MIEICGGLLLVVGLLTRLTALALAADMLGAIAVSGLARWETVSLTLAPVLLAAMIILTRFGPVTGRSTASGREHEPPLHGLPADLFPGPRLSGLPQM